MHCTVACAYTSAVLLTILVMAAGSVDSSIQNSRCFQGTRGAGTDQESDMMMQAIYHQGGMGMVTIVGKGNRSISCVDKPFQKMGDQISVDLSDCLPEGLAVISLEHHRNGSVMAMKMQDISKSFLESISMPEIPCPSHKQGMIWCYGKQAMPAPACYKGRDSLPGIGEQTAFVMVKSYGGRQGTLYISGTGLSDFTCEDMPFSRARNGKDLSIDTNADCMPHTDVTLSDLRYCANDDTMKATAWGVNVPVFKTSYLSRIDCPVDETILMF